MTESESRGDRISRRAILASLPVTALAGGFAAGGIAGAITAGTVPAVVVGGPVTSTPAPLADPRPFTDATTSGILGDGVTDNAKALNTLIAAAPAGHDILLPSGEYLVSGRLTLRSGVNLVGSGVGVTTIRLVDGADAPFVLVLGQSSLRISGITFDGGSQDQQEVALQLDGCTDVMVENCAFVRMSHAVHVYRTGLDPSGGIVLRSNHFSQITDFAIRVTEGVESVLIENNVVEDVAKGDAPTPAAIYVRGSDVTVSGNTVLASDDTAVLVSGSTTKNVIVAGNRLTSTLVTVYYGTGATEGTIVGNTLESLRDFGVHLFDREGRVSRSIVAQNQIVSSGKSGIQVEGVSDFVLSSNLIYNPGTRKGMKKEWCCGIVLTRTSGGTASRFAVTGNLISSDTVTSFMQHAILVSVTTDHVEITSNVCRGSRGAAVKLDRDLNAPYTVETDDEIVTSRALRTP